MLINVLASTHLFAECEFDSRGVTMVRFRAKEQGIATSYLQVHRTVDELHPSIDWSEKTQHSLVKFIPLHCERVATSHLDRLLSEALVHRLDIKH